MLCFSLPSTPKSMVKLRSQPTPLPMPTLPNCSKSTIVPRPSPNPDPIPRSLSPSHFRMSYTKGNLISWEWKMWSLKISSQPLNITFGWKLPGFWSCLTSFNWSHSVYTGRLEPPSEVLRTSCAFNSIHSKHCPQNPLPRLAPSCTSFRLLSRTLPTLPHLALPIKTQGPSEDLVGIGWVLKDNMKV